MSINQKISFFIISIIFIALGCAPHIPKSEYPVETEKLFHASFDKTWNSVLEVIRISEGTIITNDKYSGLITYSVLDKESKSQIYMNVYLRSHPDPNITVVYLFPKVRSGYYLKEIERDFFEKLRKILGR